jgi:hypothetical protein
MKQIHNFIQTLVITILVSASFATYAQDVIEIQPGPSESKDCFIFSIGCSENWAQAYNFCANTNTNTWGYYETSTWTYFGALGTGRGLIQFDLSSLSEYTPSQLVSAQLVLTKNSQMGDASLTQTYIQRINSTWSASTATWNDKPTIVTTDLTNPENRISVASSPTSNPVLEVDMTAMVKYWLTNPGTNHGLMHSLVTESTYRSLTFLLSENANASARPKLILTFNPLVKKYYSKSTGNLNSLATWGENTDGSGTSPLNFTDERIGYVVVNNTSPTINANWTVSGNKSTVIVGNGTGTFNLIVPSGMTMQSTVVQIKGNATVIVNGQLEAGNVLAEDNSKVQYVATSSVQNVSKGTYYNLDITGLSSKLLKGEVIVKNIFVMASNINCDKYFLALGTGVSKLGTLTYTSGAIQGKFKRWLAPVVTTGNSGLFPVGTSSYYRPLEINYTTAPQAGGLVTVQFMTNGPSGIGLPIFETTLTPLYIDQVSNDGYWKVNGTTINGGIHTVKATGANFQTINQVQGLRLMKRNNPNDVWMLPGNSIAGSGTVSTPVISRSGLNSLTGDFCVGGDKYVNPIQ